MDHVKFFRYDCIFLHALAFVCLGFGAFVSSSDGFWGMFIAFVASTTASISINSWREFRQLRERIEQLERQLPPATP